LGRNLFKRASTDEDLIKIIQTGISGTPMPPGQYTEFQAGTIVAYLRSMATTGRATLAGGDAQRGKAIYEGKGACVTCHRAHGVGSRLGPDLSDVGSLRRTVELEKSLLDPDFQVLRENRLVKIVTRRGETLTGRILNIDTFSVQILDTKERL